MARHDFGFLFDSDFFESVFGRDAWRDFNRLFTAFPSTAAPFPPHNIYALKDGSARIDLALAGYSQADVSIRAEDGQLIIESKGDGKADDSCECGPACDCGDDCECVYHGIRSSAFKKAVRMPSKFDLSKAQAKMKDGMLSITVPLAEDRKAIAVDIQVD
jgi:HSP20 family molecular chaperone IbpA